MSDITDDTMDGIHSLEEDKLLALEDRMCALENNIINNNTKLESMNDQLCKVIDILTKNTTTQSVSSMEDNYEPSFHSAAKIIPLADKPNDNDYSTTSALAKPKLERENTQQELRHKPNPDKFINPQMYGIDIWFLSEFTPMSADEIEKESEGRKYIRRLFSNHLRSCLWGTQKVITSYKVQTNTRFVRKNDAILKFKHLFLFHIKAFVEYNSLDPDIEGVDIIIAALSKEKSAVFNRIMAGGPRCWKRAATAFLRSGPKLVRINSFCDQCVSLERMDPRKPFREYIRNYELYRMTHNLSIYQKRHSEEFYNNIDDDVREFVDEPCYYFKNGQTNIYDAYLRLRDAEKTYRMYRP